MSKRSNTPENKSPLCFLQTFQGKEMMELRQKFVGKHGRQISVFATLDVDGKPWRLGLTKSVVGEHDDCRREVRKRIWFAYGLERFSKHYKIQHNNLLYFKYKGESNFDAIIIDHDSYCSVICNPEYQMCFLEVSEGKMMLPPEFVTKHGQQLSVFATLSVANGEKWTIGLAGGVPSEDQILRICFESGLEKFLQRYSIKPKNGHLIFFKYKGGSEFDVDIIDQKTGCEINYEKAGEKLDDSCLPKSTPKPSMEIIKVDDDDESESFGPVGSSKRHVEEIIKDEDEENESPDQEMCGGGEKLLKFLEEYPNVIVTSRFGPTVPPNAQLRAASIVRNLKPQRPCFLAFVYPRTQREGFMSIARKFADKYLEGAEKAKLEVSDNEDDEFWLLDIQRSSKGSFFRKGWSGFAKENGLVAGDILVFEKTSEEDDASSSIVLLKVHINHDKFSVKTVKTSESRRVRMKID